MLSKKLLLLICWPLLGVLGLIAWALAVVANFIRLGAVICVTVIKLIEYLIGVERPEVQRYERE